MPTRPRRTATATEAPTPPPRGISNGGRNKSRPPFFRVNLLRVATKVTAGVVPPLHCPSFGKARLSLSPLCYESAGQKRTRGGRSFLAASRSAFPRVIVCPSTNRLFPVWRQTPFLTPLRRPSHFSTTVTCHVRVSCALTAISFYDLSPRAFCFVFFTAPLPVHACK